ncbi:MAG: hypothetical protein ACRCZ2_09470 [Fusobacteriaceae bacterium]
MAELKEIITKDVIEKYKENDICLIELLSDIKLEEFSGIEKTSLEDIFQIILELKILIDGDIYREVDNTYYSLDS